MHVLGRYAAVLSLALLGTSTACQDQEPLAAPPSKPSGGEVKVPLAEKSAESKRSPFQAPSATKSAKLRVTIGKETTYLTEPLRPDGYPDYIAAIDARSREGVTPENNAAVLLVESFGPAEVPERIRSEFFEALGVSVLPEHGEYFVSQEKIKSRWIDQQKSSGTASTKEQFAKQFELAVRRPWTDQEFPIVADWLRVNSRHLQAIRRAADREKLHIPFSGFGADLPVIFVRMPYRSELREWAGYLQANSMFEVGRRDVEAGWRDLQASHRLARLAAQEPTLIDGLISCAIEGATFESEAALAHFGEPTSEQIATFRSELQALSPLVNFGEKLAFAERLSFLDSVNSIARDGTVSGLMRIIDVVSGRSDGNSSPDRRQLPHIELDVDWDVALRMGNQTFDRLVELGEIGDPRERRSGFARFDEEMKEKSRPEEFRKLLADLAANRAERGIASRQIGEILKQLLLANVQAVFSAQERAELLGKMTDTALALATYRVEHGDYPEDLDPLVPKYLAAIPDDTFAPEPMPIRYRREGDAYVLWTVFNNGRDDGGAASVWSRDSKSDDIGLRPVPVE